MQTKKEIAGLVNCYKNNQHLFQIFQEAVVNSLRLNPILNAYPHPIIHSIKTRLKDPEHLTDKIIRKNKNGRLITEDSIFNEVTDLAGVRVLHLHQSQAKAIHDFIIDQVKSKEWHLNEKPIAYSWDPDATDFFKSLGLKVQIKASHYTSIHYVIRPKKGAIVACEIQVRTLFDEIWGEIDHTVNYPHPTSSPFTREQLKVLSKLVNTGTRLADSIFKLDAS